MAKMTPEEQKAYDKAAARIAQAEHEGLTGLNLSSRLGLTELPPEIGQLTNLEWLRLDVNRLTAVPPEIGQLTNLERLHLDGNRLTAVPPEIGQLTNLEWLSLDGNRLTAVPPEIGQLTNLRTLKLFSNELTVLPSEIGQLTNLEVLSLGGNQLTAIPPEIVQLTNLHKLYLSDSQLKTVPPEIIQLTNLQTLNLGDNQLTAVPPEIVRLTNLEVLSLGGNRLTAVPPEIVRLTNLQTLYLYDNELTAVPEWLVQMPHLKNLYIYWNPITQPPPELFGVALTVTEYWEDGAEVYLEAVRRYYAQQRREGSAFFYEAKLLIVGEGGAGKTSLVRKLQDTAAPLPLLEDSTDGIDIEAWSFPLPPVSNNQQPATNDQNYHVNIWDFGGQTVYHATHQFFLTKRSVYVLVADTRRQHTDFYDWLKMQETFGADSPIILLKNLNREHGNQCVIENLPQLRERFPNLKEIVEIDLNNVPNEAEWPDLLRYLEKHFLALDHIGVARPKTWVEVRQVLDADSRDTISREEYLALCAANGIPDPEDALQLSDYLHHLGDILHFQDDPVLTDLVILKPTWGLDAVYRVLDNNEIAAANGQFTLSQLRDLWHEARYHHHRDKLLRLMQKFQLCYPLRDVDDTFIAPQLLGTETPDYEWVSAADDLQLRYSYPIFMPRGILSRAIVALHHRIEEQRLVWRTGVILRDNYARAELLELRGEGEIRIRVNGSLKRDLLMEIVRALDDLHRGFPKLRYEKLVPCNCETCTVSDSPHFFRLGKLLERLQHRRETIECDNPPYAEVQIRSLIDDAILQSEVRYGDIHNYFYGDFIGGDRVGGDKVGRDKTGGDHIDVGDVVDSDGIVVGREARGDAS
ncbi:MAG: leucine-rich repeat domain-containing protein [Ardenticatenaceae bacterium]|nr:leucine-rich repeat domain-containing protein [Ardenticatenaceae bacterium]